MRKKYGIRFGDTDIGKSLKRKAERKWGSPVPFLHPWKKVFDTVHIPVLASITEEIEIGAIETKYDDIFHVCATSYCLHYFNSILPKDEFIINAQFFHLLILENLNYTKLDKCLLPFILKYKSPENFISIFPLFQNSDSYLNTMNLFHKLKNRNVLY